MQSAVADQEKQKSDDGAGTKLRPARTLALCDRPEQQNRARREMPEARGVKRRNGIDGVADRQVGGAPNNINGKECGNHANTAWMWLGSGSCGYFDRFECGGFRLGAHLNSRGWRVMTNLRYTHYEDRIAAGNEST